MGKRKEVSRSQIMGQIAIGARMIVANGQYVSTACPPGFPKRSVAFRTIEDIDKWLEVDDFLPPSGTVIGNIAFVD